MTKKIYSHRQPLQNYFRISQNGVLFIHCDKVQLPLFLVWSSPGMQKVGNVGIFVQWNLLQTL